LLEERESKETDFWWNEDWEGCFGGWEEAIKLNLANWITLNQSMRASYRKDSANTLELSFFESINSSQILTAC
jgi:hypothetical protein